MQSRIIAEVRDFLAIVVLSVVGSVTYGVVHDQFTVRASLEYFTIFHPRVIASQDPTALAFAWGFLATWWLGLVLGMFLAIASRMGPWPSISWRDLLRPVATALLVMGALALAAFATSVYAWKNREFYDPRYVPVENRVAFHAVWNTHIESYVGAVLAGVTLVGYVLLLRRRVAIRSAVLDASQPSGIHPDRRSVAQRRLLHLGLLGCVLFLHPFVWFGFAGFDGPVLPGMLELTIVSVALVMAGVGFGGSAIARRRHFHRAPSNPPEN